MNLHGLAGQQRNGVVIRGIGAGGAVGVHAKELTIEVHNVRLAGCLIADGSEILRRSERQVAERRHTAHRDEQAAGEVVRHLAARGSDFVILVFLLHGIFRLPVVGVIRNAGVVLDNGTPREHAVGIQRADLSSDGHIERGEIPRKAGGSVGHTVGADGGEAQKIAEIAIDMEVIDEKGRIDG